MRESVCEALQPHLEEKQYRDIVAQYHFAEEELEWLMQMGAQVEKQAEPVLYYEISNLKERVAVIVSLGSGIDELQEQYMRRELLTESYMIECISMELLRVAYEQAAERIYARTGMWVSEFDFPGDKEPLQCVKDIFRRLKPQGIAYNHAYVLTPKKTVAFFTDLCVERQDSYCRICAGCGNLSCRNRRADAAGEKSFEGSAAPERSSDAPAKSSDIPAGQQVLQDRKLTYGYQRIFGGGKIKDEERQRWRAK